MDTTASLMSLTTRLSPPQEKAGVKPQVCLLLLDYLRGSTNVCYGITATLKFVVCVHSLVNTG